MFGQTGITFWGTIHKVVLFHHHFCAGFDMWYKRLYLNESRTAGHNKTDQGVYSSSLSEWNGFMKGGGVIWIGVCAVAWDVERLCDAQ